MKIFLVVTLILVNYALMAQRQSNSFSTRFRSQNYIGLLEGDAGSSFQLQTINGIRWKSWFGGIGTGFDYYIYRSIPLFASLNKSIKPAGNSFYFLSDAGINFVWKKGEMRSRTNDYISDKFTPSLYWNGGAGYKAVLGKKQNALLISLAYSYKHLKETKTIPVFCINPPCEPEVDVYNYDLKRVSIRLGWEF